MSEKNEDITTPDPADQQQDNPTEPAASQEPEKPAKRKPATLVVVVLDKSIAFDGIALRPVIKTREGQKPLIEPVKAVVPFAIAQANGLEVVSDAPHGATIGVLTPTEK